MGFWADEPPRDLWLFAVEAEGRRYDEMHVDGSVISGATVLTEWQVDLDRMAKRNGVAPTAASMYVVRNGCIAPEPAIVDHGLIPIAGRPINTLLKGQGVGDLLSASAAATVRRADYHVTWIGGEFQHEHPGPFDPEYMKALYDYGFELMMSGNAWARKPPVLMTDRERAAISQHLVAVRHQSAGQRPPATLPCGSPGARSPSPGRCRNATTLSKLGDAAIRHSPALAFRATVD